MKILKDLFGNTVRLTDERYNHILEHEEMNELSNKIEKVLSEPDYIIQSVVDTNVNIFTRFYITKSFGGKYLCVVIKYLLDDAFIITSYITNKLPKGETIWQRN